MPREVAERAIDFALSIRANDVRMDFFGGEPLMEWDLLRHCTGYAERAAARAGVRLTKKLTTNGTLLTPERVGWLRRHGFAPDISVDGDRAMHDVTRPARGGGSSFDAVERGVELLLEAFPDASVVVVPDPSNVALLAEGVRFLVEEKGARRVVVNPNLYAEWPEGAREEWRDAYERIADLFVERYRAGRPVFVNVIDGKIAARLLRDFDGCELCRFAAREMAVAPSGRIYPCDRMVGDDVGGETCIGDVSRGLDEARRDALLAPLDLSGLGCGACPVKPRCMNWCRAVNHATTGSTRTPGEVVCFHERMSAAVADQAGGLLVEDGNLAFVERFGGF
jgi:uncharacterized protein